MTSSARFQSRVDGSLIQSTDPGLGLRDGTFANLNKFKTPSLRGLAARAPYFHGGTAKTLEDVVRPYEDQLGSTSRRTRRRIWSRS
jgi:cytochrome c peroxidase